MHARGRNGGRRGGRDGGGRGAGRGGGGRSGGGRGGRGTPLDTSVSLSRVLSYQPSQNGDASPVSVVRAITGESHVDELILRLAADANLERIDGVLRSLCRVDGQRTFQNVVLPFAEFLTSSQFKQSLHKTTRKALYRRVANEELFLSRLINCFVKQRATLEALDLLGRGVSACVELLYQICTNLPTLVGEDPFVYEKVHELHTWIHSNDVVGVTPQTLQLLSQSLDICEDFLPPDAVRARHGDDAQTPAALDQYLVQPQAVRCVNRLLEHDRGPRHDNDHAYYGRIQVLPTHEEIRCLEEPRLPFYPDSSALLTDVVDFHFRLVREDMLAQLRRGIQWFLGGPGLGQFHRSGAAEPPRHENIPKLLVCNNVEFDKVACHSRKGVFFTIRAAQPRIREASAGSQSKKAKAARREFWEGDRLSVGSLVALALGVPKTRATAALPQADDQAYPRSTQLRAEHVFFGQVASRDDRDLLGSDQTITTHLKFSDADAERVLRFLRRQDYGTDSFLIEAAGVCFLPTQAILQTLQAYEIVQPPPLLEQIFCVGSNDIFTQTPVREGGGSNVWTLQHLVRDEAKTRVDLRHVPITTFDDLCAQLHPLEQQGKLKLDGSQVEAFAAAMTRACCLIQGPPGTGKSYVGVKIVETLLAQPRAAGAGKIPPILCVCYTNHALDQFLEDLVKSRACALHDIVRIGRRSKSETLQTRNLFHLETTETHDEHFTFRRLYKQCKDHEESVFAAFNDKKNTSGSLLKWLDRHHHQEYRAIVSVDNDDGEDDDGFETKDSRGTKPVDRWKSWLAGKTAPALLAEARQQSQSRVEGEEVTGVLAECDGDIWRLSKQRRKVWADTWTNEWLDYSDAVLTDAMEKYEEYVEQMRELNLARRLRVLRSCKIVGMTTTGCAQNQDLVRALAPKIVVCEEAGEVLEAHLLSCITPGIQQLIQIGDHQQLRPPVTEYKLSASADRGHNLDISLFERLVNDRFAFYGGNVDLMRRRGVLVTLQTQRRMRPAIADLVRLTLYPTLQDAPAVREYPHVRGFRDNVWFFDHDHAETANESSKSNTFEAEMVVELVSYALKQGYKGEDIAVLTPYLGQLRVIRRLLSSKSMRIELDDRDAEALAQLDEDHEKEETEAIGSVGSVSMQQIVRLSTVDNFQGDEATLVFISTVRCNKDNKSGFLKISNRMNVMLSRARHGMVILGSARTVRQEDRARMFLNVLDILEERQSIGDGEIVLKCEHHGHATRVTCANDIRNLTPDGGCLQPCQARLPCGHACPKMCHIDDPEHRLVRCLEPCDKQVEGCGHYCRRLCSDECACSHVYEEKTRVCGHTETRVTCPQWRKLEKNPCTHRVQVKMPVCGHVATLLCPTARTIKETGATDVSMAFLCNHACGGTRENCGHACKRQCGECLEVTGEQSVRALRQIVAEAKQHHAGDCRHECDRAMACGHYCRAVCHPAGQCPPCDQVCDNKCSHSVCSLKCSAVCASCSESCDWTCPHTGTTCPLPCGSPCIRLPCNERCGKRLPDCGHQCPGLCGEACLSSGYCRECGPSAAHTEDVVDLIMHGTLGDHDPTESPLILLGCGHALTVETLDGIMGISDFYDTSVSIDGEVAFTSAKPLDPEAVQGDWSAKYKCPHCRFLIVGGINRYGRVLKYAQTRNGELKFLQEVMVSVTASRQRCATQSALLNGALPGDGTHKKTEKEVRKMYDEWKQFTRTKTPTQELMVKEMSRLDRLQLQAETLNLAAYRQVIMKQSLIHLRLELLNLYTLWLQAVAASKEITARIVGKTQAWQQSYHEAVKRERELLTLCDESNARRSKWDARVAGVRLRCWFVLASHCQQSEETLTETVKAEIQPQLDAMKSDSLRVETELAVLQPLVEQIFRPAVFYQQMTEEEKRSVQQAMGYDSNHMGQFGGLGGHWYACPNGHPYVITECGGPMQQGTCAECQAPIGGGSHHLLDSNTSAQAYFRA